MPVTAERGPSLRVTSLFADPRSSPRRRRRWLVVPPLLLILVVTLAPAGHTVEPEARICLICGDGALADALLNIVLFMPLGAALAATGATLFAAAAAGFALSFAIELTQLWIPGRYTALADLLANGSGSILGWLLLRHAAPALHQPRVRRAAALAAMLAAVLIAGATPLLLAPAFPGDAPYFGQYARALPLRPAWDGTLDDASIADSRIAPHGEPTPAAAVREPLLAGAEPLRLTGTAGTPPDGRAPIFSVATRSHELFFVAAHRNDAIFRFRTNAARLGLSQPEHRVAGAFRHLAAGEPLLLQLRRRHRDWCLAVGEVESCGLAFSIADGWTFLKSPPGLPHGARSALGWLWLLLLAMPAGLLTPPGARLLRGSIIVAAPLATSIASTSVAVRFADFLALAMGFVLGALLAARFVHRPQRRAPNGSFTPGAPRA